MASSIPSDLTLRDVLSACLHDAGAILVDPVSAFIAGFIRAGNGGGVGPTIPRERTMITNLLVLISAQPGETLPPNATIADQIFAYGAVALLIGLVWWQNRSSKDQ